MRRRQRVDGAGWPWPALYCCLRLGDRGLVATRFVLALAASCVCGPYWPCGAGEPCDPDRRLADPNGAVVTRRSRLTNPSACGSLDAHPPLMALPYAGARGA